MAVIGVPWPPSGEALFQREYNDVFRYGRTLDLAYYLDWGWQEILLSKARAAGENLLVFAEPFLFYLLPFALVGFWRLRRDARAWPFLAYTVALYLAMTLLFTFAGPRGSFLHSMAALLPFFFVASRHGHRDGRTLDGGTPEALGGADRPAELPGHRVGSVGGDERRAPGPLGIDLGRPFPLL